MRAGRLAKICGLFRLGRTVGGLMLVLTLGHAALVPADPAPAVLEPPLMLVPPAGPQPGEFQPGASATGGYAAGRRTVDRFPAWDLQVLPSGLIYHSYLAGTKEPRFATQWFHDSHWGWTWDSTLGARIGLLRYGTTDLQNPQGWQLDLEGAAFPRLDLEHQENVTSTDFRFGAPFTYGCGPYQMKFGYFHICSHLGDEFMLANPGVERINYVRNGINWGHSYYCTKDLRIYGEAAWAFECDGGAKPWEFQFGVEYSPAGPTGLRPVPFLAINGDIRQEVDYGGNICVETGYQWRSPANRLLRAGVQYFSGKSDQYEFFKQYEEKLGLAFWYDF